MRDNIHAGRTCQNEFCDHPLVRDGGRFGQGKTDLRERTAVFDAHVDELPSQRGDRVKVSLEFFGDGLPRNALQQLEGRSWPALDHLGEPFHGKRWRERNEVLMNRMSKLDAVLQSLGICKIDALWQLLDAIYIGDAMFPPVDHLPCFDPACSCR